MGIKYSFPPHLHLSRECVDIIAKIFVGNPANRITVDGIRSHPWFLKNLPDELRVRPSFILVECNLWFAYPVTRLGSMQRLLNCFVTRETLCY